MNTSLQSAQLTGLSSQDAERLLLRYGPNEIKVIQHVRWYHIVFRQFMNIMVLILLVALVVSMVIGEILDAWAIGIIVLINATVGFIQEFKAEKTVEALKKMTTPFALVRRDNVLQKINARELVPGDVLVLEEGREVPADARLIEAMQLSVVEASLTGESQPVEKGVNNKNNHVFLGTTVARGHGLALVEKTGMQTEFGKIAHLVQSEIDDPTPLQRQLNGLSKMIAISIAMVAGLLFVLALLTKRDLLEMFLLSISLAVSVIPEGLPTIITLTLALGVQRIAKSDGIIRKLAAAETLGSVNVICTDKTGTLTQNEMTVKVVWINDRLVEIPGIGYQPTEKLAVDSPELELMLRTAVLCNNSSLMEVDNDWRVTGDPTEGALLTLAAKGGMNQEALNKEYPREEEFIFDSERKRMSTFNKKMLYTKGAPDSVLTVCTRIQWDGKIKKLTKKMKENILKENDKLARKAYRVLSFAYKQAGSPKEENMIFLGLAAMLDPARTEVKAAVEKCKNANIRTVMITGDHALTAQAIGKAIGLYKEGDKTLTGDELEKMSMEELKKWVQEISIYSRVKPAHKVKILKALQSKGLIVAMTGDGVNDAPALKSADIGIAMGITGTDVSKQASDMILMDDNFATIVSTVEEGRIIYRNIKKFMRFLFSANFDEVILISVTFLLGFPAPFIPLQILWVNLLTDALPALALGTDNAEKNVMLLRPRRTNRGMVKELIGFSLLAGLLSAGVSLTLYFLHFQEHSIERLRTLMFSTVVVFELFLVFSARFEDRSLFSSFFSNKLLLLSVVVSLSLQMLAIYHPFFQKILQTEPLRIVDWMSMLGASAFAITILEIWKKFHKKSIYV